MIPNFLKHEPMCKAKRYDRKQRKMVTIGRPNLINEYNHLMNNTAMNILSGMWQEMCKHTDQAKLKKAKKFVFTLFYV